jgi:hypothetical protein
LLKPWPNVVALNKVVAAQQRIDALTALCTVHDALHAWMAQS